MIASVLVAIAAQPAQITSADGHSSNRRQDDNNSKWRGMETRDYLLLRV
jgi:hypothetical protein